MTSWRKPGVGATAFMAIGAVLILVFGVLLAALAVIDRRENLAQAVAGLDREASAIGIFVRDAVLKNDFQNVQSFVAEWSARHGDTVSLIVAAPNGFQIAAYNRAGPVELEASASHGVQFRGAGIAAVTLIRDIGPQMRARNAEHLSLLPYGAVFLAVLAIALWEAVRRLVLRPMEAADADLSRAAGELSARNADLRRALVRAEEASRAKSQFLAAMSHELRTPLNAIIGFSDMMRHETVGRLGSDRYRDYAGSIHDSGRHLLELINDVLDVSKIDSGAMEISPEEVALHKVVHAAVRMVRDQAAARGLHLSLDLPDPVPVLMLDPRRVKQVLLNLLSNAVKFTDPGGRIGVTATFPVDGGAVVVSVFDTGIGMTGAEIATAISPFGQADGDLNRRYSGTGLGLPLAKQLTELHGGVLDVTSEPGVGTTVSIRLPAGRVVGTQALPAQPDIGLGVTG